MSGLSRLDDDWFFGFLEIDRIGLPILSIGKVAFPGCSPKLKRSKSPLVMCGTWQKPSVLLLHVPEVTAKP